MENNNDNNDITIAVFGSTGRAGKHVVTYALSKGYHVRAFARTPSKLDSILDQHHANNDSNDNDNNNRLIIIEGDFNNNNNGNNNVVVDNDVIRKTIQGATYVTCVAGGPENPPKYPKDLMINFVSKKLWPLLITMNDDNNTTSNQVKVFLYQSGAFCLEPNQTFPLWLRILRFVISKLAGIGPIIADNEAVTSYLYHYNNKDNNNNSNRSVQYIVTRPCRLVEEHTDTTSNNNSTNNTLQKEEEEIQVVRCNTELPYCLDTITYKALAKCTVDSLFQKELYGKHPYVPIVR